MSTIRDRLRAKTVGSTKQFLKETVTFDGEDFEVRQPSVKERSQILIAAGLADVQEVIDKKKGTKSVKRTDLARLQIHSVVYCTYVPGTDERVFEIADIEGLMEQPANSFVDALAEVAMKLLNVEPEDLGNDSEETQSGDSSSA